MVYILQYVIIFLLIAQYHFCIRVYNNEFSIISDKISYLEYGDNLTKTYLTGYIINGLNYNISDTTITSETLIFGLYKITSIDFLGSYNVSSIYEQAMNNNLDGVFVSASSRKVTGEILYFYYENTKNYNIYKFEINQDFLDEINKTFPNGAYFEIILENVPEDRDGLHCRPYFNHWEQFYTGPIFYISWIVQILFALIVLILSIYTLIIKFKLLLSIFKLCIVFYIISSFVRVCYGITFIGAKIYKQGEYVIFFKLMDIIGGLASFSFSLSGILLYASFWQIISKTKIKEFSKITRTPAIISSIILTILTILGILFYFLADSELMYYICYAYFAIIMLLTTIFYTYVMIRLIISVDKMHKNINCCDILFNKSSDNSENRYRRLIITFIIQFTCLLLIIILFGSIIYLIVPFQSSVLVCLVHELIGVIILVQLNRFMNIGEDAKSSTKGNSKSGPKISLHVNNHSSSD